MKMFKNKVESTSNDFKKKKTMFYVVVCAIVLVSVVVSGYFFYNSLNAKGNVSSKNKNAVPNRFFSPMINVSWGLSWRYEFYNSNKNTYYYTVTATKWDIRRNKKYGTPITSSCRRAYLVSSRLKNTGSMKLKDDGKDTYWKVQANLYQGDSKCKKNKVATDVQKNPIKTVTLKNYATMKIYSNSSAKNLRYTVSSPYYDSSFKIVVQKNEKVVKSSGCTKSFSSRNITKNYSYSSVKKKDKIKYNIYLYNGVGCKGSSVRAMNATYIVK